MKIGFLPLYIKLYDDCGLTIRARLEAFYESLAQDFEKKGFEVIRSDFCRVAREFKAAVEKFEDEGANAIVTWHAAYSPSLESVKYLSETDLPLIVLDTTETYDFSPEQDPDEINLCHGIHGVMDMTNMLNRAGKQYAIAAGAYPQSDVLERAARLVRIAVGAGSLYGSRVGTIGGSFDGMGDFLISDSELLERFGVRAVYSDGKKLNKIKESVTDGEIDAEIKWDKDNCRVIGSLPDESHRKTVKNCLAVRKWLDEENLSAFTVNFLEVRPENGLDIMPFMEACKAMARGIGYAGEGDVLTAAITGALIRSFDTASFVEIFCPDWKGDTLFLSHMGEINYALCENKPEICEIPFTFGKADDPVVGYGCYKSGSAVFVNVFNDGGDYSMLISPVEMQKAPDTAFEGRVRGWMKPCMKVSDFLSEISYWGVTHHSSLVYGATLDEVRYFGELLGLDVIEVK